jgi:transketolase
VSFTEDVEMRFRSYGWNVLHVEKGDVWVSKLSWVEPSAHIVQ